MNKAEKEQAEKVRMLLLECNSHQRLERLLAYTENVSDAVFWNVFASNWSDCDATWHYQGVLLHVLHSRAGPAFPASKIGTKANRGFFASLADPTTVYRGCSRELVLGLSWTTEINIARGFARKHRGVSAPDLVVAQARIPKDCIFTVFQDRQENEILLDPENLQDLKITPLKAPIKDQK